MAGAALLGSALLLHTFKEDVRDGAVAEGAIVTSRTISDKRVQAAAELVAKEVALDLLSNPQVSATSVLGLKLLVQKRLRSTS